MLAAGAGVAIWRVLCGDGPVPKALGRLIDTVVDHLDIKNDIKRANASAEIERIRAESEAEVSAIKANAKHQLQVFKHKTVAERARVWDEVQSDKRQRNRESVLFMSAEELKSTPDSEVEDNKTVDPNWTSQFFTHVQDVSTEEMQLLWAKLLAGEIKRPGTFSLRTLEKVKTLSITEADAFRKLCSVSWTELYSPKIWAMTDRDWVHARAKQEYSPLTFDYKECLLVAECGLIAIADTFTTIWMPSAGFCLEYFGQKFFFQQCGKTNNRVQVNAGTFQFTTAGEELARIAKGESNPTYLEAIIEFHRRHGWKVHSIIHESNQPKEL